MHSFADMGLSQPKTSAGPGAAQGSDFPRKLTLRLISGKKPLHALCSTRSSTIEMPLDSCTYIYRLCIDRTALRLSKQHKDERGFNQQARLKKYKTRKVSKEKSSGFQDLQSAPGCKWPDEIQAVCKRNSEFPHDP